MSLWHPVTWLSLMLDVHLFGGGPAPHHAVNVALHAMNAALLFLFLASATGAARRALLAAALFAIHPLRVESVAWISERKDVLSALFFFLTLAAWAAYARRGRGGWYATALAFFATGLLCKPMLVTTPVVLLLLDVWPLGRLPSVPMRRLVLEKLPFLALAAAASVVAVVAQAHEGSVATLEAYPLASRAASAAVAPFRYLEKTLWPTDLGLLYPARPTPLPVAAGAAAILLAVTLLCVRLRRTRPYLLTGWLWFLVMLLPVLGLVQVGRQSIADRYTYLPLVGVAIAAVWTISDALRPRPALRGVAAGVSVALVAVLALATRSQIAWWTGDETLFLHSLASGGDDPIIRNNLGVLYASEGRTEEARAEFERSVALSGSYVAGRLNLGLSLAGAGRAPEAEAQYREALRVSPRSAAGHERLGTLLLQLGRDREAFDELREALRLDPDSDLARSNLEVARARLRPARP